ncbi:hypothetical protein QWY84_01015 [Aquisalimonas lutea]|uniref:DUF4139 domain-containing protein n=1 Tax=Aquisalimonas lutea TaxID=1327750 RepID=UPI0025B2E115|nr:DUF4139 domain-containing protein [Aquisalimonas lutea]MDN3516178.1 hypothetical protein [Aquisalimonas lutea]
MRTLMLYGVGLTFLGLAMAAGQAEPRGVPAELRSGALQGEELTDGDRSVSGAGDRERLVLTLHQGGLAQVFERRQVGLRAQRQLLRLQGVPAEMQTRTLTVSGEGEPMVHGVRLRNRLVSPDRLLDAYRGREVRLVRERSDGTRAQRRGRLLGVADGQVAVAGDDGVELLARDGPWRVVVPGVPDSLVTVPALDLELTSELPGRQWLAMSYLTPGLGWQAGYVLTLDIDAEHMGLQGWAELSNDTATAFRDADIRLVAGASVPGLQRSADHAMHTMERAVSEPEAVAEQYRFRLQEPVSLEPGDQHQVRLLAAADHAVERTYRLQGQVTFGQQTRAGEPPVTTHLHFDNTGPGLGRPLPAGPVRVYQRDDDGEPVLMGEDRMPATPSGEAVALTTGAAFDLVAERRQTGYRRLDDDTEEQRWRIRIRNAGDRDRTVRVEEAFPGDWTILEASREFERPDARHARWTLTVPAEEEVTLAYRVEIRR